MASTRSATGNSKPRVFPKTEVATTTRKPAAKKSGTKKSTAKANTSKPRAKKAADKVTKTVKKAAPKKKAPAKKAAPVSAAPAVAPAPHEPTLLDKLSGALLKVEGAILGKPGKKAAGTKKMTAKKPKA